MKILLFAVFTLALIFPGLGCSGTGGDSILPSSDEDNTPLEAAAEPGTTLCLGLWQFLIDRPTESIQITSLRTADQICNVLSFMEPPALTNLNLDWDTLEFGENTVNVEVKFKHPLDDNTFTGFDVRGVVFGPRIGNMDGMTIIPSPEFFENVPFGYVNGLLGAPQSYGDFKGLSGYKYYCDGLKSGDSVSDFFSDESNVASRGMFSPGATRDRDYELDWTGVDQSYMVFNYAVYANYDWPTGPGPYDLDDFPINTANSAEPFCAKTTEKASSVYYTAADGGTGNLSLDVEVWDWQGDINNVTIESVEPGIIDETTSSAPQPGTTSASSIYRFYDIPVVPPDGNDIEILITVEDGRTYGECWFMGLLPTSNPKYGERIISCFMYTATVSDGTHGSSYIGLDGGTLSLPGVEIVVPPEAFDDYRALGLNKIDSSGLELPSNAELVADVVDIDCSGEGDFNLPVLIALEYTPVPGLDEGAIIPYGFDIEGKPWPMLITDIDTDNDIVEFATAHFSVFTGLQSDIDYDDLYNSTVDTGYLPVPDGWRIKNTCVYYNCHFNCLGMATFASWFYSSNKTPGIPFTERLHYRYRDDPVWLPAHQNYNASYDDVVAFELAERAHSSFPSQKEFMDVYFEQQNMDGGEVLKYLLINMAMDGFPAILIMGKGDKPSHAVVAYRYSNSILYINDPNAPGEARTITVNKLTGIGPYGGYTDFGYSSYFSWTRPENFNSLRADADNGFPDHSKFPDITIDSHTFGEVVDEAFVQIEGTITGGEQGTIDRMHVIHFYENPPGVFVFEEGPEQSITPPDYAIGVTLKKGDNFIGLWPRRGDCNCDPDCDAFPNGYAGQKWIKLEYSKGWARTWGGSQGDYGYEVAVDGSGNAYVTGFFENTVDFDPGPGVDEHTSNGGKDIFLSKFNSNSNFQWARTWGGFDYDAGYGVAVDGSGNAYITGWFNDTVDFDPGPGVDEHTSNGSSDIFLSKFDSAGHFQWARTWGGSDSNAGYGIAVDGSGNAYITGDFTGTVDFDPGSGVDEHISNGSYDIFLSKFDSAGVFQWARTWGGGDIDVGVGVAVDGSGNAYIAGYFYGTVDFDPGASVDWQISNGGWDTFLSKFDSAGVFQWARTWGGTGDDRGVEVAIDGNGNTYITGFFWETVDFDPGSGVDWHLSYGGRDIFLSKVDSAGDFQWARTWGGNSWECGQGVAIDGSGNAYITGDFYGTFDFNPGPGVDEHTSNGFRDIFLSKFDSTGVSQWARTWGGTGSDSGWGVAVGGSGNAYVTGFFESTVDFHPDPGVDWHTSNGGTDIFLNMFPPDGNW